MNAKYILKIIQKLTDRSLTEVDSRGRLAPDTHSLSIDNTQLDKSTYYYYSNSNIYIAKIEIQCDMNILEKTGTPTHPP